jgi:hypothetical protein
VIEFTDHALRKMFQRNLKKAWVRETLSKPEYAYQSYQNREIAYRKIGKLYLAVVFVREEKGLVVLTAHWDKRFKPKKEAL